MRVEEIRKAKSRVPFEPFFIRTADGRELLVKHPDAVAWDVDAPRSLVCVPPGGDWEILDLALVTSIAAAPRNPPAEPKRTRKKRGAG